MSIQIRNCEFSCPKCNKVYIPLYNKYPCSSCHEANEFSETFLEKSGLKLDYIDKLIGSMKYYKGENGQFVPHGCYIRGIEGNIQNVVCWTFDKIEDEKLEYKTGMFDEDIKKYFGPEHEYILQNVKDILNEVHKRYQAENFFIIKTKWKFSMIERIKDLWNGKLIP